MVARVAILQKLRRELVLMVMAEVLSRANPPEMAAKMEYAGVMVGDLCLECASLRRGKRGKLELN